LEILHNSPNQSIIDFTKASLKSFYENLPKNGNPSINVSTNSLLKSSLAICEFV